MSVITTAQQHRTRHGLGFWLIAAVFVTAMAFSTVSTPLYPLYEKRDGFGSFTVTIVFAVYAVGVVTSLLLFGHVSDWVGRRRILLPALSIEIVAAVVFVVWPDLPGLIMARFITGFAVGMITATATAHLSELHAASRPEQGTARFELVSTAANIGGLGLGPLVAGILAQWAPAPLTTPYLVFAGLLGLGIVAVQLTPETVVAPTEPVPYRPQRVSLGHGDKRKILAAMAAGFTAFAVFGLFTSLAPTFLSGTLGHPARVLAGAVVFIVFTVSALAQSFTRGMAPHRQMLTGIVGEAAGLVVLTVGVESAALAPFLVGGALAGAGAGVLFKSAIGTVVAQAPAAQRGEALAGLFLIAYLGLIGPVLAVGLATQYISTASALLWFSAVLLLLLLSLGVLARRRAA
ncbi:Predicted arabinose efflux permease, MFS family [Nakamurella panacisegetis]|uniref:Predicted arabinose efflux permease, MFS family n=1 Tax=Nakamurella panacisegetis TaxID=1090615 RepID=A0A1H0HLU4_9ACTN|nr:MFS transporter [Nakamurella panacisegetis]SDO20176.1 Predicted arabinose efflux permease, MFS family [Nakamurella panacisegetis]